VTAARPAATVPVVTGRAGRLAALGALALLALMLAAAEPRAGDGSLGAAAAVDQYVAEASAVAGTPAPRVKPTDGQPVGKRTAALLARLAAGAGAAVLAVALLGAVPAARRARRSRWCRTAIRAPPALLLA
jgi:hypothetical protein